MLGTYFSAHILIAEISLLGSYILKGETLAFLQYSYEQNMTTLPDLGVFFSSDGSPPPFSTSYSVRSIVFHALCRGNFCLRSRCAAAPVRTGKTGYIHEERPFDERILLGGSLRPGSIDRSLNARRVTSDMSRKNATIISYATLYLTPSIVNLFYIIISITLLLTCT